MAWKKINDLNWQYDNDPPNPGGALTTLWETGTSGIRTNQSGDELYTNCRIVGSNMDSVPNELNKTYWDGESLKLYNEVLELDPIVSSQAPASTRPVQQGQVCEFDGVNDYAELPARVLSHNQAWSIEVDFKYLATPTYRTIYGEGNSATGTPQINLGILGTHSRLDFYWRSDNNTIIMNEALFPVYSGNRHTVKVAFDGVDEVTVWKDGVNTDTFTITPLATTVDRATIGANERTSVSLFANAQISQVKTTQNGSTVAQYNLNHASGTTAYDSSGNGNHGELKNGAAFVVDNTLPPEADKLNLEGYSKRMLFDGTDDIVEVFDNETVPAVYQSLSDDITIEANIWRASSGGSDAQVWRIAETVVELRQIGTSAGLGIPFSFGVDGDKIALGVTDDYTTGSENRQATTTLSLFKPYHIKVVISGDNYEFFLDGVSDGSGTFTTATGDRSVGANSSTLTFGSRSKDSGVRDSNMVDGVIWGAKISTDSSATVIGSWNGYGNTDADWTDQIGSNNGTVNGSPENLLLPRDESDPANDIDGNPLQYSGSVYPRRPEYRNSYAAGNMMFQYSNTHTHASNTTTVYEVRMKRTTGTTYLFSGDVATNSWFRLTDTEAEGYLFATFTDENLSENLPQNVWIDIKVTIDEGTNNVTVEYKLIENSSYIEILDVTWAIASSFVWGFSGRKNTSVDIGGDVLSYKVTQDATVLMDLQFTNGAGDTIFDVGPAKNHATVLNGTTATEGLGSYDGRIDGEDNALNNNNGFSKRMLFDGVNDDISLPSNITSEITDVTGATWVCLITTNDNTLSKQTIVSDFDGVIGGNNKGFMIRLSGDDVIVNYLTSGGAWVGRQATAVVNSNTLTHITVTWSGGLTNGAFKIYVNGAQVDDADYSSGSIGAWQKSDSNYTIGSRYSTGGVTNRFKGIISDPSFYSEELSSADVLDMYNGDTPDDTNLIAQYNGYGNTDADWTDQVGSNDGTVNGSPALLRVPADTSEPTKDVLGDTLTNPAITDGYNGAETELDAYNIAEGDNPSPATSGHSALDAIESGTEFTSDDSVYNRITSAAEDDRLITFTEDLTGDDKTLAEKYTQNP